MQKRTATKGAVALEVIQAQRWRVVEQKDPDTASMGSAQD